MRVLAGRSAWLSLRHLRLTTVGVLVAVISLAGGGAALPAPMSAEVQFSRRVTLEGVRDHQRALQRIADRSDGIRSLGTPGYARSATYVADRARAAGLDVTVQPLEATLFREVTPSELEQVAPNETTYTNAAELADPLTGDFAIVDPSPSGNVTAAVVAVDVALGAGNTSDSGCSADSAPGAAGAPEDDFADFPSGAIALVQRGSCSFAEKTANAEAAGAVGVIFFNQGDVPDDPERSALLLATLEGAEVGIPVVGISYALGASFVRLADDGLRLRLLTDTEQLTKRTTNVLAETPDGRDNNVVMLGAHLDSVPEGPGINDNGSGSAVLLEIAEQMGRRDVAVNNKVRFAWWGAEEVGLVGSATYIERLAAFDPPALDAIALYLNFDMVGSPNFVRYVYDGDGDVTDLPGPRGSAVLERFFKRHFAGLGLATAPTALDGRSDYAPFAEAGIPVGGLFTGAEGAKTPAEARVYGGEAGEPYDPCYHKACDRIDNVSRRGLEQMTEAIARAALHFAISTRELPRAAPAAD